MRRGVIVTVVASVLLSGCGWAHPRFDLARTGANPGESTISAKNVASLQEQFRFPSSTFRAIPWFVVTRGHAYVGGNPDRVFDSTGGSPCTGSPRVCAPQWTLQ